jgi:small subunit ribosomal protein S12
MPTCNQLLKEKRIKRKKKNKTLALLRCPQRKGICLKTALVTPKKPNSALRKVARVILTSRYKATTYIPGKGGHNLLAHSVVLVRGGRTKDVPGLKYKAIRGKYDLKAVPNRVKARSKYGIKSFKTKRVR